MKKLYIAPELKVVRVNVNPLMHQSALLQLRGNAAKKNGGGDYETLSRGNRFFSDDEE